MNRILTLLSKSVLVLVLLAVSQAMPSYQAKACGGADGEHFPIHDEEGKFVESIWGRYNENDLLISPNLGKLLGQVATIDTLLEQAKGHRSSCFAAYRSSHKKGSQILFRLVDAKIEPRIEARPNAESKDYEFSLGSRTEFIYCDGDILDPLTPNGTYAKFKRIDLHRDVSWAFGSIKILTGVKELLQAATEKVRLKLTYFSPYYACGGGTYYFEAISLESDKKWGMLLPDVTGLHFSEIFDGNILSTEIEARKQAVEDIKKAEKIQKEELDKITADISAALGLTVRCYDLQMQHSYENRYRRLEAATAEECQQGVATLQSHPELVDKMKLNAKVDYGSPTLKGILISPFGDNYLTKVFIEPATSYDDEATFFSMKFDVSASALSETIDVRTKYRENERAYLALEKKVKEELGVNFSCKYVDRLTPEICQKLVDTVVTPLAKEGAFAKGTWIQVSSIDDKAHIDSQWSNHVLLGKDSTAEEVRPIALQVSASLQEGIARADAVNAVFAPVKDELKLDKLVCEKNELEKCNKGIEFLKSIAAVYDLTGFHVDIDTGDGWSRLSHGAYMGEPVKYWLTINVNEELDEILFYLDDMFEVYGVSQK